MRTGIGSWFDGISARRHEVAVRLTPDGLHILQLPGESELAFWALRDLRPVDEATSVGPYRIRNAGQRRPARPRRPVHVRRDCVPGAAALVAPLEPGQP